MSDSSLFPKERSDFAADAMGVAPNELQIEELEGGNLNHVWRVQASSGASTILKHAPPYIAALPDQPLDDSRIVFEHGALEAFRNRTELRSLISEQIRPPNALAFDRERKLLLMEDVGDFQPLLIAIGADSFDKAHIGRELGKWIGRLHRSTLLDPWYEDKFCNLPVQRTRYRVQYDRGDEFLQQAGIEQSKALGERCRQLGAKFNSTGRCLIMGDLWPDSIMLKDSDMRLIDWEFCHFGYPAQDVAHLAAHCWMIAHCGDAAAAERAKLLWHHFWDSYRAIVGEGEEPLFSEADYRDAAIHFGAEILARTVGPFRKGYLYGDLATSHPKILEAVRTAAGWIAGKYRFDRSAIFRL